MLFYYFKDLFFVSIYNEKTFKKILDIDLYTPINEYETKKEENKLNVKNNTQEKIKISIKELYNGAILFSSYNYLIEVNLHGKTYDIRVVKELDDCILDINELSDKRIIVFSYCNIIVLKKDKEEYMIIGEYKIKDNWKISSKGFEEAKQYFLSDELSNNRLLISSFIIGFKLVHGNMFHRYVSKECSNSKIIFINTNNFEEIKSTKKFKEEANHILLEHFIIIHANKETLSYDINSLELIQNFEVPKECGILYKFDNKHLFSYSYSKYMNEKILLIYKIENNKFIKQFEMESGIFTKLIPSKFKWIVRYYKFLFVLKDKRIIIITSKNKIILFEFPSDNLN